MSDRATTEQIRTRFAHATRWEYGHRRAKSFAADFDRWLASHDAEVRADEREKAESESWWIEFDPNTHMGPFQSKELALLVRQYVERVKRLTYAIVQRPAAARGDGAE